MKITIRIPLLIVSLLLLTGCSAAIEKIQQITGSQIKNIENKVAAKEESPEIETKVYEEGIPKSPTVSLGIKDILQDDGTGRYAGKKFNLQQVKEALDGMPKGLSEEKIYAYLLGLVGENYKEEAKKLQGTTVPHYETKLMKLKKVAGANQTSSKQSSTKVLPKSVNVAILIDASGSMGLVENGKKKIEVAKNAVLQFVSTLPKTTSVVLQAYGHKGNNSQDGKPVSCGNPETLYIGNTNDLKQIGSALSAFDAKGWTPLEKTLTLAKQEFSKKHKPQIENMVLVVTDGRDNCGGTPSKAAKELYESNLNGVVNVIGLNTDYEEEQLLKPVAEVTGGDFQNVKDEKDLKKTFAEYTEAIKQINDPWPLKALKTVVKTNQQSNEELKDHHEKTVTKLNKEQKRLNEANSYIKEKEKIGETQFIQIKDWIDKRKKEVKQFADQQLEKKKDELTEGYQEGVNKVEQIWQKQKEKLKPYQKQKTKILEEANSNDEEKKLENQT